MNEYDIVAMRLSLISIHWPAFGVDANATRLPSGDQSGIVADRVSAANPFCDWTSRFDATGALVFDHARVMGRLTLDGVFSRAELGGFVHDPEVQRRTCAEVAAALGCAGVGLVGVGGELEGDADAEAAFAWLKDEYFRQFTEKAQRWSEAQSGWSLEWREAAGASDSMLELTPDELTAMQQEIWEVAERYRTSARARAEEAEDESADRRRVFFFAAGAGAARARAGHPLGPSSFEGSSDLLG